MKHFCVITNRDKDYHYELAGEIESLLKDLGATCMVLPNKSVMVEGCERYTDANRIPDTVECAIVLGGDGTMIQAANDLAHKDIMILGVNIGTMGFLTEVEQQNLVPALKRLVGDDYGIQSRTMLQGTVKKDGDAVYNGYALNDFVVGKRGMCRLITVHVYINEEWVDTYRADGLIASTPTGSTGYNLSAGGPVLAPDMHSMVITPICAHSLNKRSLVISASDVIRFEIGRSKEVAPDEASVMADGKIIASLKSGDSVELHMPEEETKLVKLTKASFFERMREKLNGE